MTDAFDRAVERDAASRRAYKTRHIWGALFLHARIYIVVNALLALIWTIEALVKDGEPLWFLGSVYGWGVGLAIHYIVVTQITGSWRPARIPPPPNPPG